jgi:hypothetical protein
MSTAEFYDGLADTYHALYADWRKAGMVQAQALHQLLSRWHREPGRRPGERRLAHAPRVGILPARTVTGIEAVERGWRPGQKGSVLFPPLDHPGVRVKEVQWNSGTGTRATKSPRMGPLARR